MTILSFRPLQPSDPEAFLVPALSARAAGGFPSPAADHYEPPISLDELLELRAPHIWLVETEGESMAPCGIMNRSRLVVDRARDAVAGNVVVVFVDNQPLVKRLAYSQGKWALESDDPAYPPIPIDQYESIDMFGVVTWSLTEHV
ncbi:DNA polymerase V [Pseudomonas nitritireducens]|uniref:DNA polymerase V n=1 Tax=Pseudomonas nitroreducens TaxID=46680 RepID=A0A7W7P4Q6_PSENT|nr:S24 family peptidase [Pseudomonas nitritireducens]MBB4867139.1 DNA polymerase V [Pseudomonas nitritireducens]